MHLRLRFGMRQTEKPAGFLGNIGKVDQAEAFADDIEQIAIFTALRIGPFTGCPFAGLRPDKANKHRPARIVLHIANLPVVALLATVRQIMAALAMAGGEIVAAHRLGLLAETLRQFGGVETRHYAASRSPMRSTGKRPKSLPMISGPDAPTGTKKRSFHEMISLKRP